MDSKPSEFNRHRRNPYDSKSNIDIVSNCIILIYFKSSWIYSWLNLTNFCLKFNQLLIKIQLQCWLKGQKKLNTFSTLFLYIVFLFSVEFYRDGKLPFLRLMPTLSGCQKLQRWRLCISPRQASGMTYRTVGSKTNNLG